MPHPEGVHPPLLLTGGPAAGKSTTARRLASALPRAAVIDVDDVRQLIVAGHAAPWEGEEGVRQRRIGVENACDLARRFLLAKIDVVLSDVVDHDTLGLYRRLLPGVIVVKLQLSRAEARRRAAGRPVHITEREFDLLHAQDEAANLPVDQIVDVEHLALADQVEAVQRAWTRRR